MSLKNKLITYSNIFLDSAPIIYLVEQHPTYLPLMREVVHLVRSEQLTLVTSPITLLECLIQPIQQANKDIEERFRNVIVYGRNTNFVPTTAQISEHAANLRVKYHLSATDAIQVATAIESRCGAVLTNDKLLARITEIPIVVLDAYLVP